MASSKRSTAVLKVPFINYRRLVRDFAVQLGFYRQEISGYLELAFTNLRSPDSALNTAKPAGIWVRMGVRAHVRVCERVQMYPHSDTEAATHRL